MPAPMSLDLRLRIVCALERITSIRQAARRFAVSPSAAIKLMQRVRTTGSTAPSRCGGHRRRRLAQYAERYGAPTGALRCIGSYAWPGNVRELENCVRYLTCLQLGRPVSGPTCR